MSKESWADFPPTIETGDSIARQNEREALRPGYIVGDSEWKRWRAFDPVTGICEWTKRIDEATRYARRIDAENVHASDDAVWLVRWYDPAQ